MSHDVIGLIPACGNATRLSPIPCSKEIFPIGLQYSSYFSKKIPRVISESLLSCFNAAGIKRAFFIHKAEKQDIPDYFRRRPDIPVKLEFLKMENSPSPSHSVDYAFPYTTGHPVALGFPDLIVKPRNSFKRVVNKLLTGDADVVLGLYPTARPDKWDMVDFDTQRVTNIVIKPVQTALKYGWSVAAWKPSFSDFLHEYLHYAEPAAQDGELHIGKVFQAAMEKGFQIAYELFRRGKCVDIGTPDDLSVFYKDAPPV